MGTERSLHESGGSRRQRRRSQPTWLLGAGTALQLVRSRPVTQLRARGAWGGGLEASSPARAHLVEELEAALVLASLGRLLGLLEQPLLRHGHREARTSWRAG